MGHYVGGRAYTDSFHGRLMSVLQQSLMETSLSSITSVRAYTCGNVKAEAVVRHCSTTDGGRSLRVVEHTCILFSEQMLRVFHIVSQRPQSSGMCTLHADSHVPEKTS